MVALFMLSWLANNTFQNNSGKVSFEMLHSGTRNQSKMLQNVADVMNKKQTEILSNMFHWQILM